tara:strand:+ start:873 stop:1319 length:447 start_codon:yes stop_codon:yes gene_type:complete
MARTKRDKIFDNKFEEAEFEPNSSISFALSPQYSDDRDEEDKIESEIIMTKIHELVSISEFAKFNVIDEFQQTKKLKKIDINNVYEYINKKMSAEHSMVNVFSELCEYFNVNPTKFYSSLGNKFKEDLIIELDKTTGILKRKNINRLF